MNCPIPQDTPDILVVARGRTDLGQRGVYGQ